MIANHVVTCWRSCSNIWCCRMYLFVKNDYCMGHLYDYAINIIDLLYSGAWRDWQHCDKNVCVGVSASVFRTQKCKPAALHKLHFLFQITSFCCVAVLKYRPNTGKEQVMNRINFCRLKYPLCVVGKMGGITFMWCIGVKSNFTLTCFCDLKYSGRIDVEWNYLDWIHWCRVQFHINLFSPPPPPPPPPPPLTPRSP